MLTFQEAGRVGMAYCKEKLEINLSIEFGLFLSLILLRFVSVSWRHIMQFVSSS